ncbi:MAG: proline dehydrogenase family protein [Bacteroidales bacterium]|nr:proline dehydrogenase family protein [Bacteroidales bacterium]
MGNLDFNNTKVAFAWKTDKQLNKAVFLFRMIGKNSIVKVGKFFTNVALSIHFPIGWAVRPTVYQHFVGGETLEACDEIIHKFAKYNVKAVMDFSVEGGETAEKIDAALQETLRTIQNAHTNNNIPYAVFKPTAFCLTSVLKKAGRKQEMNADEVAEIERFNQRVETLCQKAYDLNIPIMIDAEDVAYQNYVDEVVYSMMLKFNKQRAIVYNTLQMYRRDRLDFLKKLHEDALRDEIFIGVKFVRGAYMERERELALKLGYDDPIHPNKQATDDAFNAALKFSVEHIDRITIFNATHNETSAKYLTQLMAQNGIEKNDLRCYFSQLYGMSDHITFNLAKAGYNATKYTPYGPIKHVLPYLIRRTEENTSVAGQTSRELQLLLKEKLRRTENKS